MSKKYLLVCEGPTDILVIDKIAKNISENINDTIEIQELAPRRDATTYRYPSHGWEEVRKWCKVYGKNADIDDNPFAELIQKRNWRALLKISNANGLIIQMDTDIVEYITDLIPRYNSSTGSTKNSRKQFAKRAILSWLGEEEIPNEIYLLLSTTSTETWILATHDRVENIFNDLPSDFDFEDINDVINRLFDLGYASYINREGMKKLKKDLEIYKTYAQRITDNLEKVCSECEEANKICNLFSSD